MNKKIIAIVLSVAMLISVLPFSVFAAETAAPDYSSGLNDTASYALKIPRNLSEVIHGENQWNSNGKNLPIREEDGEKFIVFDKNGAFAEPNGNVSLWSARMTYGKDTFVPNEINLTNVKYIAYRMKFKDFNEIGTLTPAVLRLFIGSDGEKSLNGTPDVNNPVYWLDKKDGSLVKFYIQSCLWEGDGYEFIGNLDGWMIVPLSFNSLLTEENLRNHYDTLKFFFYRYSDKYKPFNWNNRELLIGDSFFVEDINAFAAARIPAEGKYTSGKNDGSKIASRVGGFHSMRWAPNAVGGTDRADLDKFYYADGYLHYAVIDDGEIAMRARHNPNYGEGSIKLNQRDTYDISQSKEDRYSDASGAPSEIDINKVSHIALRMIVKSDNGYNGQGLKYYINCNGQNQLLDSNVTYIDYRTGNAKTVSYDGSLKFNEDFNGYVIVENKFDETAFKDFNQKWDGIELFEVGNWIGKTVYCGNAYFVEDYNKFLSKFKEEHTNPYSTQKSDTAYYWQKLPRETLMAGENLGVGWVDSFVGRNADNTDYQSDAFLPIVNVNGEHFLEVKYDPTKAGCCNFVLNSPVFTLGKDLGAKGGYHETIDAASLNYLALRIKIENANEKYPPKFGMLFQLAGKDADGEGRIWFQSLPKAKLVDLKTRTVYNHKDDSSSMELPINFDGWFVIPFDSFKDRNFTYTNEAGELVTVPVTGKQLFTGTADPNVRDAATVTGIEFWLHDDDETNDDGVGNEGCGHWARNTKWQNSTLYLGDFLGVENEGVFGRVRTSCDHLGHDYEVVGTPSADGFEELKCKYCGNIIKHKAPSEATLEGYRVSLSDKISAQFVVDSNSDNLQLKVIEENGKTHFLNEFVKDGTNNTFTFDVPAKEMSRILKIQPVCDGAEGDITAFSIKDYSKRILAGTFDDKVKATVKAMLNYGAAAQKELKYDIKNPVNNILTDEEKKITSDTTAFESYKGFKKPTGANGIDYKTFSLNLLGKTEMFHYFNLLEGSNINDFKFELMEGETVKETLTPEIRKGRYCLCVKGINATGLDKYYIIKVTNEKDSSSMEIKASPFTYAYLAVKNLNKQSLNELMFAMADYNKAAIALSSLN